eukprot:1721292-Rhodomonas_salina.2
MAMTVGPSWSLRLRGHRDCVITGKPRRPFDRRTQTRTLSDSALPAPARGGRGLPDSVITADSAAAPPAGRPPGPATLALTVSGGSEPGPWPGQGLAAG